MVKNPSANAGDVRDAGLIPGSGKDSLEEGIATTPVLLPGKSHGQRSSAWGHKELDMTEVT